MPKVTLYNLNGSAGAFVSIPATIVCRRAEIVEDESGVPQGLDYQLPSDNFTATFDVEAGTEPIILGNVVAHGNDKGPIIGMPAQKASAEQSIAATTLIKLRSKTANTTKVRVSEFE